MTPEELYSENENLVFYILNREFKTWVNNEDIQQIAKEGLWKACKTYNEVVSMFSTYACKCIRNEIMNEFRRRRLHEDKDIPLSSFALSRGEDDDLDEKLMETIIGSCEMELPDDYHEFFSHLTERETDILSMLYYGYTQAEISEILGISKQWTNKKIQGIREKASKYILGNYVNKKGVKYY